MLALTCMRTRRHAHGRMAHKRMRSRTSCAGPGTRSAACPCMRAHAHVHRGALDTCGVRVRAGACTRRARVCLPVYTCRTIRHMQGAALHVCGTPAGMHDGQRSPSLEACRHARSTAFEHLAHACARANWRAQRNVYTCARNQNRTHDRVWECEGQVEQEAGQPPEAYVKWVCPTTAGGFAQRSNDVTSQRSP